MSQTQLLMQNTYTVVVFVLTNRKVNPVDTRRRYNVADVV